MSQSTSLKGTPIYIAPEIYSNNDYSKASDVYSFSIIVYEIMTSIHPFQYISFMQLLAKMIKGERPDIELVPIPESYKNLITRCWSQEPKERPTFEEIVSMLRNDKGFIIHGVNESEFQDYIQMIDDNNNKSYEEKELPIKSADFKEGKALSFRRYTICMSNNRFIEPSSSEYSEEEEEVKKEVKRKSNQMSVNERLSKFKEYNQKKYQTLKEARAKLDSDPIQSFSSTYDSTKAEKSKNSQLKETIKFKGTSMAVKSKPLNFPVSEFIQLNEDCKNIVISAENDPDVQFLLAKHLIEGSGGFPKKTQYGIMYLKSSIDSGCTDSILYYCQMLYEGKLILQDVNKAKKLLKKSFKIKDSRLYLLYGRIMRDENNLSEATKYFEKAAKNGNAEAQYELGQVILKKKQKNSTKEAINYFEMSKLNGSKKSELFMSIFNELSEIDDFDSLPDQTQRFFISHVIDYYMKSGSNPTSHSPKKIPIFINSKVVKMLYKNKTLKSSIFNNILNYFEDVSIELKYPSKVYETIFKIISKKKKKIKPSLKVYLSIFDIKDVEKEFEINSIFNRVIVDLSVHSLKSSVFAGFYSMTEVFIPSSLSAIGDWCFSFCYSLVHVTIPSSVTVIQKRTFNCCRSLKDVFIPSTVKAIEESAFYGCSSLASVSLPSSIKRIGEGCFEECSSLASITIPSKITEIKALTFSGCTSLTRMEIPSSVKAINDYAFFGCTALVQIDIPPSVKQIGERAFYNCCCLSNIKVPKTVSKIGYMAFDGCKSLPQNNKK